MNNNFKLDNQLNLDLNIPENLLRLLPKNNMWEVIVKYNGDINIIKKDIDAKIEILSSSYAILTLKKELIPKLALYRQIEYIERPKTLALVLDTGATNSCVNSVQNMPNNLKGKGVIVGVIDSGINYLNKEFNDKDGKTRILYILDQSIGENGEVYTKKMIDEAISSTTPYKIVPHKDDIGHGSAVTNIATSSTNGIAPESNIIVVKIGEKGRNFFARNTEIMRGIKFILDKAIELNMPVAINLSFGTNDGEHTGSSLFETYIDDMCNIWKTSIVVATGNEGNTSHHYQNVVRTGEKINVEMKISGDLKNFSITLFKNFVDNFSFNLILPNKTETGIIKNNSKTGVFNFGDISIFYYISEPTPYNINQNILFQIASNNDFLDSGILNIEIIGENIVLGNFDMWLPSVEISSKDTKFLIPSTETTLTIPSTANNVISVGGYNDRINSIANFSGRGYTALKQIKPDLVAPAVNINVIDNTLGDSTVSGTSMSAPFVTGACAILMQWGITDKNDIFLYGQRLKAFLRLGAKRDKNLDYPNPKWGFGSLCVSETLKYLKLYRNKLFDINKFDINNTQTLEDAIYSEDYITNIAQYNNEIEKFLQKYHFIKYCKLNDDSFIILYIPKDAISILNDDKMYRKLLEEPFILGTMNTQALETTGVLAVQNQPFLQLKGRGVLIGILDTGINYTLDEFIYEDNTTKIVSIWDQNIRSIPPKNKCYGTEYTRDDINKALNSENPFDIVPTNDFVGHGTSLASICAGFENTKKDFVGVAPDAELVVVKLKEIRQSTRQENFIKEGQQAYDSTDVMLAIEYLYEKAQELDRPISICIGLGTNDGAHNGFSILEQYINSIAIKNGICISVCNGNEADASHHAFFKLTSPDIEKIIEINVEENTDGFITRFIAYPSDKIGINVTSPLGETTGKIPPRDNYDEQISFTLSNSTVRIQYFSNIFESSGQVIKITIKNATAGIWKMGIYGERIIIGDIHAWLPITNFIGNDIFFLTPDPFYTATVPATSSVLLAVGGYNDIDGSLYAKSGRGPTRALGVRPLVSSPSVNVSSISNNGMVQAMTGTSFATSIATGCSALLLQWGIIEKNDSLMNTTSIIGYFINGAKKNPEEIYPNNLFGFGKLNILETFKNI